MSKKSLGLSRNIGRSLCLVFSLIFLSALLQFLLNNNFDGAMSFQNNNLNQRIEVTTQNNTTHNTTSVPGVTHEEASVETNRNHNMTDYSSALKNFMGYDGMDYISNATMELVKLVANKGDNTPAKLANISSGFLPAVVGEEFVHLGDVNFGSNINYHRPHPMELLGKKMASHEAIKIVWFGGSNTQGRSRYPFVKQVHDMINTQYTPSSPSSSSSGEGQQHESINDGQGGRTSCSFARGFKSDFFNVDAKGADVIFLENAVNDGILSMEDRLKCLESLILRIQRVAPNVTLVALSLKPMEGHDVLIRHYNLPQIYLGEISKRAPEILQDGGIHVNDIGSFLVCQAVGVLLQKAEYMYTASKKVLSSKYDHDSIKAASGSHHNSGLPERLYESAENFDWVLKFGKGGHGWAHQDVHVLSRICAPALDTMSASSSDSNNRTGPLFHVDNTGNCSESILSSMQQINQEEIPCNGCADTSKRDVVKFGGGWIWCNSPWPAVCKPQGVHHHHCSSNISTGILMQTFEVDNRATDDWPSDRIREVTIFMRLLKGYDADFGQAMVIMWIREATVNKTVATLIDTKWDAHATVLDDVEITPSFQIPSPSQHEKITLMVVVVPLSSQYRVSNQNEARCRLYFHSILGEFS